MAPGAKTEDTEEVLPGIVRLTGRLRSLNIRSPSQEPYKFVRDEATEVLPGDWAWFARLGNDFVKFEVILEPGPAVPPDAEGQD